jgi:hypothetical protein
VMDERRQQSVASAAGVADAAGSDRVDAPNAAPLSEAEDRARGTASNQGYIGAEPVPQLDDPKGHTFIFHATPLRISPLHRPLLRVQDTTQVLTIARWRVVFGQVDLSLNAVQAEGDRADVGPRRAVEGRQMSSTATFWAMGVLDISLPCMSAQSVKQLSDKIKPREDPRWLLSRVTLGKTWRVIEAGHLASALCLSTSVLQFPKNGGWVPEQCWVTFHIDQFIVTEVPYKRHSINLDQQYRANLD